MIHFQAKLEFQQIEYVKKKKDQEILKLKNTVSELKNSLERFNSRPGQAKERINRFYNIHLKF